MTLSAAHLSSVSRIMDQEVATLLDKADELEFAAAELLTRAKNLLTSAKHYRRAAEALQSLAYGGHWPVLDRESST